MSAEQVSALVQRFVPNDKTESTADGQLRWCSRKTCPNGATSSTLIVGWRELRACDEHAAEMWRQFT